MSQPLRIALADDEPLNIKRLSRLLEDCGCSVVASFGNGLEVEEWMATGPEVDALYLDAVDYLLKPVTTERLVKSLAKVRRTLGAEEAPTEGKKGKEDRYPVQVDGGLLFLPLARTTHFLAEDQAVWAFAGERFRTKWRSLGEVEAFFPDSGLLRIHRHLLIRPQAVLGIRSTGGGARVMVRMNGGIELEASRGATPSLKRRLGLAMEKD